MALPVGMPGPHSHPATVEKGGKDINRLSGIRAHSEECSSGDLHPAGAQWHCRVVHKHTLHMLNHKVSQQSPSRRKSDQDSLLFRERQRGLTEASLAAGHV